MQHLPSSAEDFTETGASATAPASSAGRGGRLPHKSAPNAELAAGTVKRFLACTRSKTYAPAPALRPRLAWALSWSSVGGGRFRLFGTKDSTNNCRLALQPYKSSVPEELRLIVFLERWPVRIPNKSSDVKNVIFARIFGDMIGVDRDSVLFKGDKAVHFHEVL